MKQAVASQYCLEYEIFSEKYDPIISENRGKSKIVTSRYMLSTSHSGFNKIQYVQKLFQQLFYLISDGFCCGKFTVNFGHALIRPRNDPSIIIKGADKGSCVVMQDREDYLKEAGSQLCDERVYKALGEDLISPLKKKPSSLVFSRLNSEGTFLRKR